MTDLVQPLDWYMLGTLKSICHLIYRKGIDSGLFTRVVKKDFAALLIAAWDPVPETAILKE